MQQKFSAIVPVYNVENYLEDCLDSIVKQRRLFDEVILINDGSTDSSREICEQYCNKYKYFTLINQSNKGLSEARNAGIEVSTGDYIVFIDSDDVVRDNLLLRLHEELEVKEYDAVFYNADIWYDERQGEPLNYLKRGERFYGKDMCGIDYLTDAFPEKYIVPVWLAAYKRKFLQEYHIYFQKDIYFEDHDFSLRVYLKAEKIICINEALYVRRCRNGSIMADKNSYKKCKDLIKVNLTIWDIMKKSELDSMIQIHFVSYYMIHLWRTIQESDYYEAVGEEWSQLLTVFHNNWLDTYMTNEIVFEDRLALLIFYRECREKYPAGVKRESELILKELISKIRKIPLSGESETVGIYGIGKHTEKMLELYKKYIDRIKCRVFFIVTQNNDNVADYMGYPVVTPASIPENTSHIIISSLLYQDDMYEQLIKAGIVEEKIVELYGENAFCDLPVIAEVLGS